MGAEGVLLHAHEWTLSQVPLFGHTRYVWFAVYLFEFFGCHFPPIACPSKGMYTCALPKPLECGSLKQII